MSLYTKIKEIKDKKNMKVSRLLLIPMLFAFLAFLLSSCTTNSAMLASSWPGLMINQDTAYLAFGQFVYAINLDNGSLKWQYPGNKPDRTQSFYAPPALTDDGAIIVGGYDHKLYKLDTANGGVLWVFEGAKNRFVASPLVTQRGIFAPNADGMLYALDGSKNPLWEPFSIEKPLWAKPATDSNCDCLYLASMDHHLYAVNSQTGSLLWKSPDLGGALVAEPAFGEDGLVYVGTFGNELLALQASSGEIKWRFATDGWVWSGARITDNKLFFGDLKGNFYILNANTGEKIQEESVDGPIIGTPALANNTIYFGTEVGTLYAYNLDGSRAWMKSVSNFQNQGKPIGGKLDSPVNVAGDKILVTPVESSTFLVALDTKGDLIWLYPSGK